MARLRSHSVAFEQQVSQEYFSGDTLHGLAERRNISRNLVWTCAGKKESSSMKDKVSESEPKQRIIPPRA